MIAIAVVFSSCILGFSVVVSTFIATLAFHCPETFRKEILGLDE